MVLRLILAFLVIVSATAAHAHRPGESYVYIDVTDAEMTGAFHIRIADLAKAFDFDADGDGMVSDAEVEAQEPAIADYLSDRLFFFAVDTRHTIAPRDMWFFGNPRVRQIVVEFDVPSLAPVPDTLEVEYRFLYDDIDPAHRPMLLQASNTRMRLAENEAFVSLVFETGVERQAVSLVPPPRGRLFADFALHGAYMMLADLDRLLLIGALLLPVVARRGAGTWQSQADVLAAARSVGVTALAFAGGMAVVLWIRVHFGIGAASPYDFGLLALSLAIVAADNFRPMAWMRRWQVALAAGLLQGAGRNDYVGLVGLNKGLPEVVLSGFALGVVAAILVAAAVLVPVLILVQDNRLYRLGALRLGSVLLVGVSAAWFTSKILA